VSATRRTPVLEAASERDEQDVVADRSRLVGIGMAAVFVACVSFGVVRYVVQAETGLATPWWGNAIGAVAIALLFLWYRRDAAQRSGLAVHGTALVATVALLVPAAYGMPSSKWWLSLVGFSVLLLGRRREAIVWATLTLVLVPLVALVEPWIIIPHAIGEGTAERSLAGLFYVALLLGMTAAFRRVAQRRARELTETAASLEQSNRVRSRFLAHMSHELRTPLQGVIAMTDVARMGDVSPEVRDQLDTAHASARTLLTLLNNVLDVTRADAGALELFAQPFSLHGVLADTLAPFVAEANDKGLVLSARADAGIDAHRIGDGLRVAQIARNLVSNAIKFTDAGSVDVRLTLRNDDPDRIVLAVVDTGRGVPADQLERIFEPFVQANPSDARLGGGAGLGLAIVHDLAQHMGGTARATRNQKGSTFAVEFGLPRERPDSPRPGPVNLLEARTRGDATATKSGPALRILVCEDDPINRKAIRMLLAHSGHEVVLTANGESALEKLAAASFDLLLTDVEMPGIDGIELIRRVRKLEEREGAAHLPIVATTAHVGEEHRHVLLEAGADGHLPKPFAYAALIEAVDRATGISPEPVTPAP
jgi:signal transduction histidine kinase/ActR/RegA family two-component response regulator